MAITRITDTDDDGSGTTGTIHDNAWLQTLFDAIEQDWAWDTYTPTWAATGTAVALGNGTVSGRYMAIGKLYIVEIVFTPGNTTTFGTGNYSWSLPTATAAGAPILGICECFDSGVGDYIGVARIATTTSFQVIIGGGSPNVWGQTVPMTWVFNDRAVFLIAYRAA